MTAEPAAGQLADGVRSHEQGEHVLQGDSANRRIQLRFGWKAGDTFDIEATKTVAKGMGQSKSQILRANVRYALRLGEGPGGSIRAETVDLRVAPLPGRFAVETADAALVDDVVIPAFRVEASGSGFSLADADKSAAQILGAIVGALPKRADSADAETLLRKFIDGQRLKSAAQNLWLLLVETLMDRPVVLGEPFEVRSTSLLFDGSPVAFFGKGNIEGMVRCDEADERRRCVRLTLEAEPDASALNAALARLRRSMRDAGVLPPGVEIESVRTADHLVLTTEPDTLRPHHLVHAMTNNATFSESGGTSVLHQEIRKEMRFRMTSARPEASGATTE